MKKSVLISGDDHEYNESIAEFLVEENSDIYAVAITPEQLQSRKNDFMDSFDVFLLDERILRNHEDLSGRTIMMTDSPDADDREQIEGRMVFKYQSIRDISARVRECMNPVSMEMKNGRYYNRKRTGKKTGRTKIIGVMAEDNKTGDNMAILLARVFSAAWHDTACMDLRFSQKYPEIKSVIKSGRGWSEFIYGCLYGRTRDVLAEPENHADIDEWGVLHFTGKAEHNPIYELETSEAELFFRRIRESLNVEYAVCIIPDKADLMDRFDFVIKVNNENDGKSKSELSKGLDESRIITVNTGVVRDLNARNDYNIRCSERMSMMGMKEMVETSAWKEMSKLAGYLNNW